MTRLHLSAREHQDNASIRCGCVECTAALADMSSADTRNLRRNARSGHSGASAALRVLSALFLIATCHAQAVADDAAERWLQIRTEHAESLQVRIENVESPTRQPVPILKYSNPVRSSDMQGEVYLWTVARRPAFVAAVWTVSLPDGRTGRRLSHEWHSLTEESVTVEATATPRWESLEPGVVWHDIPDAPQPSRSAPLRLVQMRQLAARFTAEIASEGESELRLLPQPVYRYQHDGAAPTDGSLFAFCMGTDPEALLWIESSGGANSDLRYRCAAAHFTRLPVTVRCDERTIETFGLAEQRLSTGRHHLWFGVEEFTAQQPQTAIQEPSS